MKTLKFARIAAATIALTVGAAQAAPLITSWDITDTAKFDLASVVPNNGVAPFPVLSNGDLSLRWGVPAGPNGQSGLDIFNFPPQTTGLGVAVDTVSITHLNHPITGFETNALKAVDILATITLNPTPSAAPPDFIAGDITFAVKFLETLNSPAGACADGTANGVGLNINGCADIFVVTNDAANFSFVVPDMDGAGPDQAYQYFVSFFGTGFTPLSDAACFSAGVANGCSGFLTAEDQDTTAFFKVQIDARPIPEPGSLALLGLGLLGLGATRRRFSGK